MKLKLLALAIALVAVPVIVSAQKDSTRTPNKVSGGMKNKDKSKDKEKEKKPEKVGDQELNTRKTDDGKINGIEFTFTQGAYEMAGATIQTDTLFQLHSGFVIDIDVLPFKIGDETYVRFVYAPYSNGEQYPSGTVASKKPDEPAVIYSIRGINGKVLCMPKEDYDTITKAVRYASGLCDGWQIATGQLSVPFKLRPMRTFGADTLAPFRMTTDVTIGVYAGPRLRPSWKYSDFFITFPVTAGLTFVNVSNNTTSLTQPDQQVAEIVPGFTWSMGLVFQYRRTNFGVVFGRDYASDYANKWIYHNDPWYSFAIGYSFLRAN